MSSVEFKRLWRETQIMICFVIVCVIVGVITECYTAVVLGIFFLFVIGTALIFARLIDNIVERVK